MAKGGRKGRGGRGCVNVNFQWFDGTQWHLSEITVAFTVLRRAGAEGGNPASGLPVTDPGQEQARPEKNPDVPLIYDLI